MFSLIQAAGWPVWFLIAASLAAVALIVERALSLKRAKVLPPRLLDEVLILHRGQQITPELIQRLESNSPIGRIFASGLRMELAPRDVMKETMEETGRGVAHELEKYLSALGTIAATAPLMGLFGTVVGMIEIFGAQAPGGTNPQQLAHGISVALYNTALGLIVAIPALICYRYFRARVDGYMVEMEQQSLRLIDTIRGSHNAGANAAPAVAPVRAASLAPAQASATKPLAAATRPRARAATRRTADSTTVEPASARRGDS
ncbi:MAG: MotA/TolQ/ExbB proton channel family protein [Burkholderiaceae bacterium]|nr:MotA/TolQ/ExbB proton channel family protein [Burkholderiaceae bacterium]